MGRAGIPPVKPGLPGPPPQIWGSGCQTPPAAASRQAPVGETRQTGDPHPLIPASPSHCRRWCGSTRRNRLNPRLRVSPFLEQLV